MREIFTGVLLLFCFGVSYGQASQPLAKGHYIVVAVYRPGQQLLAKKYSDNLNQSGNHAAYGYDTPNHYLYVYLDYFSDFNESIKEMLKTRKSTGFEQAWVRVIKNGASATENPAAIADPVVVQKVATESKATAEPTPPMSAAPVSSGIMEVKEPVEAAKPEEPKKENPPKAPSTLANTKVFMNFFNPKDHSVVDGGEVEFVDSDRSRSIATVKGNEFALIPDPKSTTGKLLLIGSVFGYRKLQHEMIYKEFPIDTSGLLVPYENSYKVDFEMVRYHKGDTETLYDVFFYNDAAIMLPESKYQLNQLLQMMQENKGYKIMLHGHTNGNAHGRLITMGPSKNFFALADDVKDGVGSAKALSGKRAEVIQEWLIANGIAADRIEAKAWGGKKMLHDKNSVNAKRNVRVEIEVLEE